LAEKTIQQAVTAIVGPSGTGKSSLVQAKVIAPDHAEQILED
jgi:putative ribosome biogenesis GTPase RsgA